jgi:hypothetical protein
VETDCPEATPDFAPFRPRATGAVGATHENDTQE